jgi:hypothetical protein
VEYRSNKEKKRREVYQPISDPLTLELLEFIKDFYFIQNKTKSILSYHEKNSSFLSKYISNIAIKRLRKKIKFQERSNKESECFLINGKYVSIQEYRNKEWDLDNVFEADEDKLDIMRSNDIFKINKRCKTI